ncbi:DUF397 domain-containing protein [Sphaerisporangium sp. NPDC049002]|uniref:DUF397 domain-containing protein n=1 Tax=Sphaerisporangium sp. NPDC049002 TaxID=3155392 RepID=UPI00340751E5
MDLGKLAWHKSTYSGTDDNCVEVANLPGGDRAVRDSKNPSAPMLRLGHSEWLAFISSVKNDHLG